MALYSVPGIVSDIPDAVERNVQHIAEYLRPAVAFVGKMAGEHPNEFIIALSAIATAIFTCVLALRTAGLFKETAGLREETAVLAKFARQQAEDMKASIAAARDANDLGRETFVVENRPWVTVNVVVHTVTVQENGMISADIMVTMKNIGRTPARELCVGAHMWTGLDSPVRGLTRKNVTGTIDEEIECFWATYTRPGAVFRRFVLLPGEDINQRWGVLAPARPDQYPIVTILAGAFYEGSGTGTRGTVAVYEAFMLDNLSARTIPQGQINFQKASGGRAA